ncbi:PE-PGRS family protein [Streptomyces sp. CBMA291]|nr:MULTISPECIES: PE-PGRS family protein [unclassified Streptomyces]MBD0709094.1 PE-PGRS family protein [Streptomyces sp. CBMA291]MBD0716244.1 PE-PGRS family protein [Streptomyces sp. CBMA370]
MDETESRPQPPTPVDLGAAVAVLAQFLDQQPLTAAIAALEHRLHGADARHAAVAAADGGVGAELLVSALTVRESLGRLNDLIHAAGIMLTVPHVLDEGETIVKRPSLGAGNDPSRPYDLETDQRVAEFKLARWRGADAARKRQTFKDLAMLAADRSGRQADLYVVGPEPIRFLRSSNSTAAWALDRSPGALRTFHSAFGSPDVPIHEFTATHARHVRITDLRGILPPAVTSLLQ